MGSMGKSSVKNAPRDHFGEKRLERPGILAGLFQVNVVPSPFNDAEPAAAERCFISCASWLVLRVEAAYDEQQRH